MYVQLAPNFAHSEYGEEAKDILGKCVHCGFCTATCPTYQLLGDELDGPRGRIYLIKEFLESGRCTATTRTHLDRCLTCRSCETTCPSGVNYGRLLEISRPQVNKLSPRPISQRLIRWSLRNLMLGPWFSPLLRMGQWFRGVMPVALARHIPKARPSGDRPVPVKGKKIIMLEGCVQPALAPVINAAASRVLAMLSYQVVNVKKAGCCGAVDLHLGEEEKARKAMRRNIDAWWPEIEAGAHAIVMTASGCGVTVKDYGDLLKDDPEYADKARRVSELTRDLCEIVSSTEIATRQPLKDVRVAFHSPCTLQHGQKIVGKVESILKACGATLVATQDKHLCCGAAGTYSVLQPEISSELLKRKLNALTGAAPEVIATANIGCLIHIDSESKVPVRHWIELLDPGAGFKN